MTAKEAFMVLVVCFIVVFLAILIAQPIHRQARADFLCQQNGYDHAWLMLDGTCVCVREERELLDNLTLQEWDR